jgi:hypothetical protein
MRRIDSRHRKDESLQTERRGEGASVKYTHRKWKERSECFDMKCRCECPVYSTVTETKRCECLAYSLENPKIKNISALISIEQKLLYNHNVQIVTICKTAIVL